jgi:hypothetical protein
MDIKHIILGDIWAKQFGVDMSKERMKKNHLKNFKLDTYWTKSGTEKKMEKSVLRATEECGPRDGDWEDRLHWSKRHCHMSYDNCIHTYIQVTYGNKSVKNINSFLAKFVHNVKEPHRSHTALFQHLD